MYWFLPGILYTTPSPQKRPTVPVSSILNETRDSTLVSGANLGGIHVHAKTMCSLSRLQKTLWTRSEPYGSSSLVWRVGFSIGFNIYGFPYWWGFWEWNPVDNEFNEAWLTHVSVATDPSLSVIFTTFPHTTPGGVLNSDSGGDKMAKHLDLRYLLIIFISM